jgi:hypothetical protein
MNPNEKSTAAQQDSGPEHAEELPPAATAAADLQLPDEMEQDIDIDLLALLGLC